MSSYSPIITNTTKSTFLNYIKTIDLPEIDYFAIGLQNLITTKSISLMSREEWQKLFTENGYATHDPIRCASLQTKRNIIPFSHVDFRDNFGREIMRQRKLMGISNGIVLMRRFKKFNYITTIATDFSKFDAFKFIKRNYHQIYQLENDFIKLIEMDAENFFPFHMSDPSKNIIRPSTYAK